jgi:hypothetical protein
MKRFRRPVSSFAEATEDRSVEFVSGVRCCDEEDFMHKKRGDGDSLISDFRLWVADFRNGLCATCGVREPLSCR